MSKRKAGVNDIIYELDNDDIEVSSEDEAKEPKIQRTCTDFSKESSVIIEDSEDTSNNDVLVELDVKETDTTPSSANTNNGGKVSPDGIAFDSNIILNNDSTRTNQTDNTGSGKLVSNEGNKTTIYNEDIVIDSPASNSDLGVVGCENRTPLVSVRFRDKKTAANYKRQLKTFMLNLIKLHDSDSTDLENETDIELDIWPEDIIDDYENDVDNNEQDGLFFVDTAPTNTIQEVPAYTQASSLISNKPEKEPSPPPTFRRTPLCFNCDGPHQLRECRLPRNNSRIAEKRKRIAKVGRYHKEDEQKYGHLIPGRISGQLRHALDLKRNELPLYIYRMRLLGYPPGWLEEARISHSGITMFDSSGTAIQDPEEEEGEVCEPGSKDKFDIKKILDFPGFNVAASSRYKEEAHLFNLPPMSEQDSKIAMLQMLAPNAMKAYKRKKLTLFPSSENYTASTQETAEMDLDSGDEAAEFPSVPPLPDEAPPPMPPPPDSPPPLPQSPPPLPQSPPPDSPVLPPGVKPDEFTEHTIQQTDDAGDKSADDLEVVEVIEVKDIPVPEPETITIDDDEDKSEVISGRESPSLDDLVEKKRALLNALQGEIGLKDIESIAVLINEDDGADKSVEEESKESEEDSKESKQESKKLEEEGKELEVVSKELKEEGKELDVVSKETANNESNVQSENDDTEKTVSLQEESTDKPAVTEVLSINENSSTDSKANVSPTETKYSNPKVSSPETKESNTNVSTTEMKDSNPNVSTSVMKDSNPNVSTSETKDSNPNVSTSETKDSNPIVSTSETKDSNPNVSTSETKDSNPNVSTSEMKDSNPNISTPETKAGCVKTTLYGTPVMNIASPYVKLPSDDKFAKDICDVINFENLPNSTGKYKQISSLLKKVKSEVDRIQES